MEQRHAARIAEELDLKPWQVEAVSSLIQEGATVPFIARYRKEATGSLDEVAVTAVRDRQAQLEELEKRRESILKSLAERGLLTKELEAAVNGAETMASLEDVYLPYRPKRRTRGTAAKEKGLEPLAALIFEQDQSLDPEEEAGKYVDQEKGVASAAEALSGARDIIAEWVNESQEARERMRGLFAAEGVFRVKVVPGMEEKGAKYRDYFDLEEPVRTAPSHRVLAMRRGEREGILDLRVSPPEEKALAILEGIFIKGEGPASMQVREAAHDAYRRLLSHAMETEIRLETKRLADEAAIRVFAANLRELLLAPPMGRKRVLAVDPGIRTGCKAVCLDRQGGLLAAETFYLFGSEARKEEAAELIHSLCKNHGVEAVAVGNGTGGRETEAFIRALNLEGIPVVLVNESGASVYSASEGARAEFPDLDLTYRGAVSIGRRLMDPLAELVKIDPKSIGVGQYQHDVNQAALKRSLDDVVVSCVNAVGVEVNTASTELLSYVSGLGPQLAANIVAHRSEKGPFKSREELNAVKRLGPKAFEQAAGFLRIRDGENPLDASAVHPESYPVVEAMAADLGCTVHDLMAEEALRKKISLEDYVSDTVGLPTLSDIMEELAKPGRDPRERLETMSFAEGIQEIGDLTPGMELPGVVTNVTGFGAFVDVGVHQDGLVHVSELADRFVKDPSEVVRVNQRVTVKVLDVDLARNRISLSMRKDGGGQKPRQGGEEAAAESRNHKTGPKQRKKGNGRGKKAFNNPFAEVLGRDS
ncbi:MAG: Tex family protein [Desulfobacteraceae bacterium]